MGDETSKGVEMSYKLVLLLVVLGACVIGLVMIMGTIPPSQTKVRVEFPTGHVTHSTDRIDKLLLDRTTPFNLFIGDGLIVVDKEWADDNPEEALEMFEYILKGEISDRK
jgi:hypothetical protein